MILLGLGLGFNFQPVILAVQNAVSPREMGVATSSVTFFRQMGGTIGTAVFLSILYTTLPNKILTAVTDAIHANPSLAPQFQRLGAGGGGNLSDTSFIQKLPEALALPFKTGFSNAIDLVFVVAAAIVAIGFFVLIFLPQIPLRTQSGIQAQQEAAGAGRHAASESEDDTALETAAKSAGASAPTSVSPASAPAAGDGTRGDGVANADAEPVGRGAHRASE
jgi:hypothetical protein